MRPITYVVGDATFPVGEGNKIIAHICNDVGGWGAGFVLALSRRWKEPEDCYQKWFREDSIQGRLRLGEVQFVAVEEALWVANMIAQKGLYPEGDVPPIRYQALAESLEEVAAKALELGATVHMPRIGCGLAGGTWEKIEPIIRSQLCEQKIPVYVYDLPRKGQ